MKDQNNSKQPFEKITENLVEVLVQGKNVLESLDDEGFALGDCGSIGMHIRHCLDFLKNFLEGVEVGQIDYANRNRESGIETNRQLAINRLDTAIEMIRQLGTAETTKPISVRVDELDCDEPANSSVLRELDFVQSHTVHHFALIAYQLRNRGIEVSEEFGVAPSTLRFWKQAKAI